MQKLKKYLKEIVVFIILLIVLLNIVSFYKSGDLNKNDLFIKKLNLIDNKKWVYDNTKPLLIHFWATWCPICKVEAPNIQTLSKDYQVITIAVDSGDDKKIKKYLKDNNLDFQVINDKNGILTKKFNISVFPTTFIYDKNKKLIFSEVGYTSTIGLKLRVFWAELSYKFF